MVKINDVKKGAALVTRDGGRATMADNKKGITRTIETIVGGPTLFHEVGSIYVDLIATADGEPIEMTAGQIAKLSRVHAAGF